MDDHKAYFVQAQKKLLDSNMIEKLTNKKPPFAMCATRSNNLMKFELQCFEMRCDKIMEALKWFKKCHPRHEDTQIKDKEERQWNRKFVGTLVHENVV